MRSLVLAAIVLLSACTSDSPAPSGSGPEVSGDLDAGLRVLTFAPDRVDQEFTIYRGDYVRPELAGGGPFRLEIPALGVDQEFPAPDDASAYFKVPDTGVFEFRIAGAAGTIEAIEYRATGYTEVSSREAADLIANVDPFILDVRTPQEFARGHIEGATLVPVQILRGRIAQLQAPKDEPLFVYCQTGNRSTVAAKMLNDAGYTRVINLRRGIVEWMREGQPVAR
jgi:rhodanese-related sulfurtransferase